ncbi:HAD family acid phosphatase [Sphingomonas sp. PR090111-T3T-6A]|uniref:HAD family acid phosphatase n=1 Tax=Sphingomonas sp. PR090111-T3T-6A TaxID=685778 RepID=UPI0003626486|nr:HAD family acid phosphatase [Sphingomonas sp. PR090111-T3T-6A]
MKTALLLGSALLLGGCAGGAVKTAYPPEPPLAKPGLAGMQYLYGSGESAAVSRQAWQALTFYVGEAMQGKDRRSVVLDEGATLENPKFVPCAGKPPAAVFDVDETVLLNQGFEYDELTGKPNRDFDDRWARWEKTGVHDVTPTPGAKEALDAIRRMGVTVIFNTNRNAFNAAPTEQAINDAGLGPAVHKQTLYLQGDDNTGGLKDVRRWWIADKYCVIAMGGDQLGDFSDLFNDALSVPARRALTALPGPSSLWGRGWFVLPNPVYGSALQGGADDIFPADKRWSDPATTAKEPR